MGCDPGKHSVPLTCCAISIRISVGKPINPMVAAGGGGG
jgi:hypothetical protein